VRKRIPEFRMQAPDFFDLFFWRFEQVLRHTSVQKVLEICQAFLWIRAAAFTALPPSKHLFLRISCS
jgi:hypothetical protein